MASDGGPKELEAVRRLAEARLGGRVRSMVPISAGLGSRRFYRLELDAGRVSSAIARVDLPEEQAFRPEAAAPEPELEPVRQWMEDGGLPVPRGYGREGGIDLLEDLGAQSLCDAVRNADPERRFELYRAATALVPRIQALPLHAELASSRRSLDASLIDYKAGQVIEWVLPWSLGRLARPSEAEAVRDAFRHIAEVCAEAPRRAAHRDLQSTNLMLLSRKEHGRDRLGIIDLQGAFVAPPEYDLVCLLCDAHVALSETEIAAHLSRTRPELPDAPVETDFDHRFTLLTLSRCGKDLARFRYATVQRDDPRYASLMPAAAGSVRSAALRAAPWDVRLERIANLLGSLPEVAHPDLHEGDPR
ncbi:MAG: phosphotransferase [Myxococcota bacterium]|nr:phosphotransferase [Myxococcota bacterium]